MSDAERRHRRGLSRPWRLYVRHRPVPPHRAGLAPVG
jgi:hypothetical protein